LKISGDVEYNYAYFPIIFSSEDELIRVVDILKTNEINPRRYFFPALNTLPYIDYKPCPIAEDLSKRVICLPLFYDLSQGDQQRITEIILKAAKN
jgi:dTDP-4-amino-4,6-dideoxygalactose transaminase